MKSIQLNTKYAIDIHIPITTDTPTLKMLSSLSTYLVHDVEGCSEADIVPPIAGGHLQGVAVLGGLHGEVPSQGRTPH